MERRNDSVGYSVSRVLDAVWTRTPECLRGNVDGRRAIIVQRAQGNVRSSGNVLVPLAELTSAEVMARLPRRVA